MACWLDAREWVLRSPLFLLRVLYHASGSKTVSRSNCQRWMDTVDRTPICIYRDLKEPDVELIRKVRTFDQCVFGKNVESDAEVERTMFPCMTGVSPSGLNPPTVPRPTLRFINVLPSVDFRYQERFQKLFKDRVLDNEHKFKTRNGYSEL